MKHNILIIMMNAIDPTTGGVERVYSNLAPAWRTLGCKVYATYRVKSEQYDCNSDYDDIYYMGDTPNGCDSCKAMWSKIIVERHIDVVIVPFPDYNCFDFFSRQSQLKVFFHVHNVPSKLMYPKIQALPSVLRGTFVDKLLREIRYSIRFKGSIRRIDHNNMKFVLLSNRFRDDFKSFCDVSDENVISMPNPVVLDKEYKFDINSKNKTVLYVGRVNSGQKRFHSVLNIWKSIQDKLPDYSLDVVGDGPDRAYFEKKAVEMGLQRITFHGFQNPTEYYKNSQASLMTSNFEGFPMVLVEAMQYGCVPFAFDSFAALHDIIDDGKNGFIIPAFNEEEYADRLISFLGESEEQQDSIRKNCIAKAKIFSVDSVAATWQKLFNEYRKG